MVQGTEPWAPPPHVADLLIARHLVSLPERERLEAASDLRREPDVGGLDVARSHDGRGVGAPVTAGDDDHRAKGRADQRGGHRVLLRSRPAILAVVAAGLFDA